MALQGATLQTYNNELVKCIEELCQKRDLIKRQIEQEAEMKQKIQNDIHMLTDRLSKLNESMSRKMSVQNEFDRTICETETAYKKILESSEILLNVLKRESHRVMSGDNEARALKN
ncbi:Sjoegren syndrome nuclear autoantigen 1 homolog [Argonauta hians]